MSKYKHLYYISGSQDPRINKPGDFYNLKLTSEGIKLFANKLVGNSDFKIKKDFIKWENVLGVDTNHSITNSVDIASFLGANSKKVESALIIRYRQNSGKVADLILAPMIRGSRFPDNAKHKIEKKLEKMGKIPQPLDKVGGNAKLSVSIGYTEEIVRLSELLQKGIITKQEFEAKKKQLLGI